MTDPSHTYLVVDDDREFAAALAAALRRRGQRAVLAVDARSAEAEARAHRPDRAIVDLRLGADDGLAVVETLRRLLPEIAVVVLTGYGSIPSAVEAMRLGAVNYLTKPASADEVIDAFEDTSVSSGPHRLPTLEELEWEHIQRVLHETRGNVSEAARRLGMHRRTLQRKLARGRPDGGGT
ncbi:MAG: response regulator [Deltaproteobacteria bacterium]|nr:MAG: response regulator [Deltaproteobacteria bacterium]